MILDAKIQIVFEASKTFFKNNPIAASPPQGSQHGPERKVRSELISVLDLLVSLILLCLSIAQANLALHST